MRFFKFLIAPWFISLIGVLILALVIWFFGPLIAVGEVRPFDSELVRLIIVMVLVVLWGLLNLFFVMRAKKTDEKMVEEIAESQDDETDLTDGAAQEEIDLLKTRLQEAMVELKRSKLGGKGGGKYLYQLPWYIIIGPPGAGKTTALVNSGLNFPLADKLGKDAISGIGGTRNCEWWFTNEAVLIDTAGRYTTQDSDEGLDSAAWTGFLGLLKKHRRRQPINGALIAISLADLATLPQAERKANALAIRKRVRELHEELGIRFPIYVLFTKSDLIAGFVEFFDDLGRDDRAQTWGFTFPLDKGKGDEGPMKQFDEEFELLVERLNERQLERLHQEQDYSRRSLIYGFPQQVASLKDTAREFLNEIFLPTRYEDRALLRGVYFTSGTQLGTPIDRLMGAMAQTFGIGRQAIAASTGSGRSYFLTHLMREVVFEEAGLVGADAKLERRQRWTRRAAVAMGCIVFFAMTGVWTFSYLGNAELIEETRGQVKIYKDDIANVQLTDLTNSDIGSVIGPLNLLRDMPGGFVRGEDDVPAEMTFGLYQGDKLGSQSKMTYRRALNGLLLPRLLLRLEEQMKANFKESDFLYEALKVYLMLGLQGPMDKDLVTQWITLDWQFSLPGKPNEQLRADLEGHLNALLAQQLVQIQLNGPLVDQVRGIITEFPLAERIYSIIKQSKEARAALQWSLLEQGGPATPRVFVRPSGTPLASGVEGFYTYNGFHDVFLPKVADSSEEAAKESWVLGPRGEVELNDQQVAILVRDVMGLYLDDYATRWDQLLADVRIVPFQSLSHSVEVTNTLSGPNSPLRNFLRAVAKETKLTAPREGLDALDVDSAAEGAVDVALTEIKTRLTSRMERLGQILAQAVTSEGGAGAAQKPGQYIDDRFRNLHLFVGEEGTGAAPMDTMIQALEDLYRELNQMAASGSQTGAALAVAAGGGASASKRLLNEATRMPAPMQGWATQLAQTSTNITVGGARSQLNNDFQSNVGGLCKQAIENRYPVYKNGVADVTLEDFSRVFKPGGMIDAFFNTNLRSFVDTASKPWKWQRVDNVSLGISQAALLQFQRAAEVRDSLFAGGATPRVNFELVPVELDVNSTQVILDINGQTLDYNHGPPRPKKMQWPGDGPQQVRIAFQPPIAGVPTSIVRDGPWAWFRLLEQAEVVPSSLSDRFLVTFRIGDRKATFELRANSVINPFTMTALGEFRCPDSL